MSYTQGVDFISNTDEVLRLARNKIPADFSTDQTKSYQYKVYSIIRTITDKDNWTSTNREYGALQLIETEVAAAMIKKHYGRTSEEVAAAQTEIMSLLAELDELAKNLDSPIASEGTITVTDYKSWNLNSAVPVPNRLRNVGSGVETKGSREIDL